MKGEWITKRLGDGILKVGHGKSQHDIITPSGKYPILATSGVIGRTNSYLYDKPSVLIGRKGTIDKPQYMDTPFWTIDTLFYTMIGEEHCAKYLYYLSCIIRWSNYNEASGVPSLSSKVIEDIEVTIPTKNEQRRIAEALSDMDALLASMEKLIAKKRAIKQGAMQELLTGKRRLPRFEGEWVEREISYYGTFTSGNGFPLAYQGESAGDYPFYKVSDFNNAGNEYVMRRANNYISSPVASILNCNIIPDGSIVFAKIGAAIFLERKRQNLGDCCIDNNMMAFTVNSKGDSQYVMYLFQTIKFGEIVTATALPSLSGKQVGAITKMFPTTVAEQTAIAEILSDMDAEIDALTAKLNKLQNIKQGMMSELLTGRIRLAESEPTKATAKVYEEKKTEPVRHVAQNIKHKGHNQQFDDAVMIAGIVDALYDDKYRLGRKKLQKCLYLLRRHQGESTAAFKKKAAGPYADEGRYEGGEPIAKNNNYITTVTGKQGTTFARGKNIGKALSYIKRWGKQADIQWVADKFKLKRVEDLELLTTVDMAACELAEAGTLVTVQSIKHLIANNSEWKAKLKKKTFSDTSIAHALRELNTLLQGGS